MQYLFSFASRPTLGRDLPTCLRDNDGMLYSALFTHSHVKFELEHERVCHPGLEVVKKTDHVIIVCNTCTGITLGFWSGGPWAHLTKILWAQGPEDQIAYYIGCVNNMNS